MAPVSFVWNMFNHPPLVFTNRRQSRKSSTVKHPYSNLFVMKSIFSKDFQSAYHGCKVGQCLPNYCTLSPPSWWNICFPKETGLITIGPLENDLNGILKKNLGTIFPLPHATWFHVQGIWIIVMYIRILIIPYISWSYIRFLTHKTCSMNPPAGCLPHVTKRKRQSVLSQPPTSANLLLKRKRVGNHEPSVALSSYKWNPKNLQRSEPTERTPQKTWISL